MNTDHWIGFIAGVTLLLLLAIVSSFGYQAGVKASVGTCPVQIEAQP